MLVPYQVRVTFVVLHLLILVVLLHRLSCLGPGPLCPSTFFYFLLESYRSDFTRHFSGGSGIPGELD